MEKQIEKKKRMRAATVCLCAVIGTSLLASARLNAAEPDDAPSPVIHYAFEEVKNGRIADQAGVSTPEGRAFSPARLRTHGDGEARDEPLAPGAKGQALALDGAQAKQFLEVELQPAIDLARDDFTISFWHKGPLKDGSILVTKTSVPYLIFGKRTYGNNPTTPVLVMKTGENEQALVQFKRASAVLKQDRWHHWVLMIDRGRSARLYLNDEFIGGGSIKEATGPLNHSLHIGGYGSYLEGRLDEFKLFRGTYDRTLVSRLYKQVKPQGDDSASAPKADAASGSE